MIIIFEFTPSLKTNYKKHQFKKIEIWFWQPLNFHFNELIGKSFRKKVAEHIFVSTFGSLSSPRGAFRISSIIHHTPTNLHLILSTLIAVWELCYLNSCLSVFFLSVFLFICLFLFEFPPKTRPRFFKFSVLQALDITIFCSV